MILAVAVTALAAFFVARAHGRLDLQEATRAAYIPTGLLFYSSIAAGVSIFYQAVHFLLEQSLPAAAPNLVVSIGVFALAAATLWLGAGKRRQPVAVLAGLAACCALVILTGSRWPTGALPNEIASEFPFGLSFMGRVLDSAVMIVAAAGIIALIAFGAWLAFLLWARTIKTTNVDGSPAGRTGYETVVLPLACWSVLLLGGALLRMRGGLLLSAFAHPVLPDPVVSRSSPCPSRPSPRSGCGMRGQKSRRRHYASSSSCPSSPSSRSPSLRRWGRPAVWPCWHWQPRSSTGWHSAAGT